MKRFNLETQAWEGEEEQTLTSLEYLQSIYRDVDQPQSARIKAAIAALAYENPKVSAIAYGHFNGQSYAEALERAIKRSQSPLPLPAPGPTIEHDPAELRGPLTRFERRF